VSNEYVRQRFGGGEPVFVVSFVVVDVEDGFFYLGAYSLYVYSSIFTYNEP